MKKSIWAMIAIVVLLIGNGCSRGCNKDDYSAFYKGALMFHQKEYVKAKKHLNEFLEKHPDSDLSGRAKYYLRRSKMLIRKTELQKIKKYFTFSEKHTFIQSLAFSSRGNKLVLATDNNEFRFYDTQLGFFQTNITDDKEQQGLETYSSDKTEWGPGYSFSVPLEKEEVTAIAFSLNGKYLVAGFLDGTVGVWQAPAYKQITLRRVHNKKVCAITFSPDDRWMVTASMDGFLNIWDVTGAPMIYQRHKIENKIETVVFCPPNSSGIEYLAVATDNYILIGSLKAEQVDEGEVELVTHAVLPIKSEENIKKLSFAPGGKSLASLHANNIIRIWNLDPKKIKSVLKEHDLLQKHLAWTSAKSDWDTWASYLEVGWKFLEHQVSHKDSDFSSMVLGHFGELLITSQADRSVIFWDVKKGEKVKIIQRSGAPIDYLLISPDNRTLVTASTYKDIFLWNINVDWNAVF